MSTSFSLPSLVLDFQYMAETTRGTFKDPGAPTAATFICQSPELGFTEDWGLTGNAVTGSRDLAHVISTMQDARFSMLIPNVISPETMTFLKRGINLADGIQATMSGCLRYSLGATAYYLALKHMLIGAGTISLIGGGAWAASVLMVAKVHSNTTSSPTNWTFPSPPSTFPLMSSDAGANHVTIKDVDTGVEYNPSVLGLTFAFNNGLFPIPATGTDTWADIIPTGRGASVRYIVSTEATTTPSLFTLANSHHECNSTIVIKTATHTLTITGGKVSPLTLPFTQDSPGRMAFMHIGKTVALT